MDRVGKIALLKFDKRRKCRHDQLFQDCSGLHRSSMEKLVNVNLKMFMEVNNTVFNTVFGTTYA